MIKVICEAEIKKKKILLQRNTLLTNSSINMFSITVYLQYQFVSGSDIQHSDYTIMYITEWSSDIPRNHLAHPLLF